MRADGKIVLAVTGGIGSGKSAVCSVLASRGIPVYDSDSRTKALYVEVPGLMSRISEALGTDAADPDGRPDTRKLASLVFSDPEKLRLLEEIVYPEVKKDFRRWADGLSGSRIVAIESAVILEKPFFRDMYDKVLVVDAPVELRLRRAAARDGSDPGRVRARMDEQKLLNSISEGRRVDGVDYIIENDGDLTALERKTDEVIDYLKKTDEIID